MIRRVFILLMLTLLIPVFALADTTITLTFTGDVTLGGEDRLREVKDSFHATYKRNGPEYFLKNFAEFFAEDDLTIVNLEGVLTDNDYLQPEGSPRAGKYFFRGNKEFAKVLTSASVEVASLANNHATDFGDRGLQDTISALEAEGVQWFGTRLRNTTEMEKFLFYEKDGVTICLMSLCWDDYLPNNPNGCGAFLSEEIQRIKESGEADAIVTIFHGGQEYGRHATHPQQIFTRMALNAGADLVICHHAHVVLGMDVINNRSAFYSLGNFCFGGNRLVYQRPKNKVQDSAPALVVRAELTFDDEGKYKGQQMTLYPVQTTSVDRPEKSFSEQPNDFQPKFVTGRLGAQVLHLFQVDTNYEKRLRDPQNKALKDLIVEKEKELEAMESSEGMSSLTLPFLPAE